MSRKLWEYAVLIGCCTQFVIKRMVQAPPTAFATDKPKGAQWKHEQKGRGKRWR